MHNTNPDYHRMCSIQSNWKAMRKLRMPKYPRSSAKIEQVKHTCLVIWQHKDDILQKDYTNQETVLDSALKIQIKLPFISGNHVIFNFIISLKSWRTATSGLQFSVFTDKRVCLLAQLRRSREEKHSLKNDQK